MKFWLLTPTLNQVRRLAIFQDYFKEEENDQQQQQQASAEMET